MISHIQFPFVISFVFVLVFMQNKLPQSGKFYKRIFTIFLTFFDSRITLYLAVNIIIKEIEARPLPVHCLAGTSIPRQWNRTSAEAMHLPGDALLGYSRICCTLSQGICGALSFMRTLLSHGRRVYHGFFVCVFAELILNSIFPLWAQDTVGEDAELK